MPAGGRRPRPRAGWRCSANHTDYNEGFVISCAIDRNTWFAAGPAADDTCVLRLAANGEERRFTLDQLDRPERGDWANYVKGILVELRQRGLAGRAVFAG